MASKIIKFSSHSNGRSLHSLCHGQGRVLANGIHGGGAKSILPLAQSIRLESRSFFSWFTTNSNNNNSSSVAASQLPLSPCMMLPPIVNKATREKVFRFFNLADKKVLKIKQHNRSLLPNHARCIGSSHNWLAFIDPRDCSLYLWNPFSSPSQEDVIQLPSIYIQTLSDVVGLIRGSDNRSVKKFIIKDKYNRFRHSKTELVSETIIEKFAFSSAPSPSLNNNDCIVMAITATDHLAYCKPGGEKWTVLDSPSRDQNNQLYYNYKQICYSKKTQQFYALRGDHIEAWDLRDLTSIKMTSIGKTPGEGEYSLLSHLAESLSGDLLLVQKYFCSRDVSRLHRIEIQKFDSGKFKNIKCLGEQALFLGENIQSFCLRAADFPGLRPNSIYFTDDFLSLADWRYPIYKVGVYNMRSDSVEQFLPYYSLMRSYTPGAWYGLYNPHVWIAPPQGSHAV